MAVTFKNQGKLATGQTTWGVFAYRVSDGYRWNNIAGAWQAGPSDADSFIELAETALLGFYSGANTGDMGNASLIEFYLVDSASSYGVVSGTGMGRCYVYGGNEVPLAATDTNGGVLANVSLQQAIKAKTDNLPANPASVSDIPTISQIDTQLSNTHGDGSWETGSSAGPGATSWTATIQNESGTPIADADVWITTDSGGNTTIASGQTDSDGEVTFLLDSGSTYYLWMQKNGQNPINGTSFTVP